MTANVSSPLTHLLSRKSTRYTPTLLITSVGRVASLGSISEREYTTVPSISSSTCIDIVGGNMVLDPSGNTGEILSHTGSGEVTSTLAMTDPDCSSLSE